MKARWPYLKITNSPPPTQRERRAGWRAAAMLLLVAFWLAILCWLFS